ncbi:alkaline phosphatase-like isoform X2 [Varroa jacobsoni]|uniref:alkaline phosphatase-like isoform X2 n=1 Tax=Varroa jacobsoni TaxID=62625 RepID=UPI000BF52D05|nr:alkaline phosphatase-like isoform X2 [Varroa jacobsoni]
MRRLQFWPMMLNWRSTLLHFQLLLFLHLILPRLTTANKFPQDEQYRNPQAASEGDPNFWRKESFNALNHRINRRLNTNVAKNIIFFLGDGMGVSTVTAGRVYKGQKARRSGEESVLNMDTFPYTSLCKTYCVDRQTTDSAASATAYLCGIKTNMGALGVTAKVKPANCEAATDESNQVDSIMAWAQKEGKWTGIVTTDQVVGASPAAAYAHASSRSFYSEVPEGCSAMDIAQQLIHGKPGSKFKVIFGGGRKHFLPVNTRPTNERRVNIDNPAINGRGVRTDGRNLLEEWLQKHEKLNHTAAYLWSLNHLRMLHEGDYNEDYILGLFASEAMVYSMDKILAQSNGEEIPGKDQPTLEEMTKAAINKLSQSPSGYVLFVEGARIDTAHHENLAGYSLEEVYQFDKAIAAAASMTSEQDTLTIVTADHSHAFTINGYASRGNDILGHAGRDINKKLYSTLSYAAGPGFSLNEDDEDRFTMVNHFLQPAMMHTKKGVHGGEDVAVYAKGPWAHLFTGTHDNTYIPHALAYAACIGLRVGHCDRRGPFNRYAHVSGALRRNARDPVISKFAAASNLTMIDHINGQTIAPDVLKNPPPRHVVVELPGELRQSINRAPRQHLPMARRAEDAEVLVSRRNETSAFVTNNRSPQKSPNRLTQGRRVHKVAKRTNPYGASIGKHPEQQQLWQHQGLNTMLNSHGTFVKS